MDKDKELERLVDKMMEEAPLETPSSNFTYAVIQEVTKLQRSMAEYKPVMSIKSILIALGMLGVFGFYLFATNSATTPAEGQVIQLLSDAKNWFSAKIPQLQISKTFSYMVGAIGLMVCFQAFVLKRYFNKRCA
ncbi:hypothetical protein [Flagellimonas sp.]|uniref:hypothetical protein n=1 Tax=Flagellimonas sp. TaxID=2058762 RepID=UPI003BAE387B